MGKKIGFVSFNTQPSRTQSKEKQGESSIQNRDRHGTVARIAQRSRPTKLCKPLRSESNKTEIFAWFSQMRNSRRPSFGED